jgi:hypothetical protein
MVPPVALGARAGTTAMTSGLVLSDVDTKEAALFDLVLVNAFERFGAEPPELPLATPAPARWVL